MGFGDRLSISGVTASGLVKAGSVAVTTGLAVIGGHMISDYMRDSKKKD